MARRKGPDTHHVVHNPAGGWDVKRGGGDRFRPAAQRAARFAPQ